MQSAATSSKCMFGMRSASVRSMSNTIRVSAREIPDVIKRAAAPYRGRKWKITVTERITLANAYWDGGSKSTYTAVDLATGRTSEAHSALSNPFRTPQAPDVEIPRGVCVLEHVVFCGKDCGIYVHVRPEDYQSMRISAGGAK